ncbi:MAG: TonB-dependent receptor [Bacteroidetes bacterium]|nr:TonB-dependent receptor [Bacteroidota bacterium]
MKRTHVYCIALFLIPLISQAQDQPEDTVNLDEVVISATRTLKPSKEAPSSVSVVTSGQIENGNAAFADEALKNVSGVYLKRSKPTDVVSSVTLRGFSKSARTLILLDGKPLNDGYNQNVSWAGVPTEIIRRIEVIRGPYSALYGGNAMGGVINIITKIPEKQALTVGSSYGTYNTFNNHIGYSNRFFSDKLGVYVNYNNKSTDGYVNNYVVRKGGVNKGSVYALGWEPYKDAKGEEGYLVGDKGVNYWQQNRVFGKLVWDFSGNTTLGLSCNISDYETGYRNPATYLTDSGGAPLNNGKVIVGTDTVSLVPYYFIQGPSGQTDRLFDLNFSTKLNTVQIRSIAGMNTDKSRYVSSQSGSNEDGGPGKYNLTDPCKTYYADLQADIPVAGHILTTGVNYRLNEAGGIELALSDWQDTESYYDTLTTLSGRQQIAGAYFQAELKFHNRFKAYLGGRYDTWKNYSGQAYDESNDTTYVYGNYTNGYFAPKAAIVFTPDFKTSLFELKAVRITYGHAFRPPTLYDMYRTWSYYGTVYYSNPDLQPETTQSFDAGFEAGFFKNHTSLNVSYFQSVIDNLIYSQELNDGNKRKENAGKGTIMGVEFDLKQKITSRADAGFNITRNNTRITENPADSASVGKEFQYVPKLMYNASLSLHHKKIYFGLNYGFTSKTYGASDNSDTESGVYGTMDEIRILDGKISWQFNDNIKLYVNVNNILDYEYFVYYKAPGRTFTAGISAGF